MLQSECVLNNLEKDVVENISNEQRILVDIQSSVEGEFSYIQHFTYQRPHYMNVSGGCFGFNLLSCVSQEILKPSLKLTDYPWKEYEIGWIKSFFD